MQWARLREQFSPYRPTGRDRSFSRISRPNNTKIFVSYAWKDDHRFVERLYNHLLGSAKAAEVSEKRDSALSPSALAAHWCKPQPAGSEAQDQVTRRARHLRLAFG